MARREKAFLSDRCDLCGEWIDPPAYDTSDPRCSSCERIQRALPVIYDWVKAVVEHQRSRTAPPSPSGGRDGG